MMKSPNHAVIGTRDIDTLERYLARFGFETASTARLPAHAALALYGLESATREAILRTPGARRGWLRLIETPHPSPLEGAFSGRPPGFDLYTRNIETSLALARSAGAECGELVRYSSGPLEVCEAETWGPDNVLVVFRQVNRRRPSLLDEHESRLHSEVHSIVWTVRSAEEAAAVWVEEAGLRVLVDTRVESANLPRRMNLPRREMAARFLLLSDGLAGPSRLVILELPDAERGARATLPLAAGVHAAGFSVSDVEAAMEAMPSVRFGEVTEIEAERGRRRAVTGIAPGGVRCELWQAA